MKKFLLKLLEHGAYTAVTIILFTVAYIGGMIGYEMWQRGILLSPVGSKIEVLYSDEEISPNFVLSDIKLEKDVANFTVTGRIQNVSNTIWYSVNLSLEYSVEGIKMGTCNNSTRIENIETQKINYFSFECSNLSPDNLPSNFSFKPVFDFGERPVPDKT